MTSNKDLAPFYNRVYKKGEGRHYTSLLLSGHKAPLAKTEALKEILWKGKTALDAGCGTGQMAYLIARRGAKDVLGIDYSQEAIAAAQKKYRLPNLSFRRADIADLGGKYDAIVMLGTIEHLDRPLAVLRRLKRILAPGGSLIVTCPNWTNPRGYILMTLFHLFGAPVTLADQHYLTPVEFDKWARSLKMKLTWKTVDQDWAHGEKCLRDFARRLPNVLRDSHLSPSPAGVDNFLRWLSEHMVAFEKNTRHGGAVGFYRLQKPR